MNSQRFLVVPFSAALVADNVHAWQKVHLYNLYSGPGTSFAAAARHIERKPSSLEATHFRIRGVFEQAPYVIKNPGESCRIRSGRFPNWALINFNEFINILDAFD